MNIQVDWRKPATGSECQGVYEFPLLDLAQYHETDRQLVLPPGTTAILHHAFENRLKRFHMWSMPSSHDCREAFFFAASIFRRGVPARYGGEVLKIPEQRGVYSIIEDHFPNNQQIRAANRFYVIDQNLLSNFPELAQLKPRFSINAHESLKTLATVSEIIEVWKRSGRCAEWVIVGGGLTGDIGAFAADLTSSRFSLVPTTLLAMVDACVGGKAGVNYMPYGKNQLGRFSFPDAVIIDRRFLNSLTDRNLRSGLAECIKHALLSGHIDQLDKLIEASVVIDRQLTGVNLEDLIRFKAKTIAMDPDERGVRAILNFGHSFGHAIEAISIERSRSKEDTMLHGEAIAAGMIFELLISRDIAGLPSDFAAETAEKIAKSKIIPGASDFCAMTGIDPAAPEKSWQLITETMLQDKKNSGVDSTIDFVLLSAPGQAVSNSGRYSVSVPIEKLRPAFDGFMALLKKEPLESHTT